MTRAPTIAGRVASRGDRGGLPERALRKPLKMTRNNEMTPWHRALGAALIASLPALATCATAPPKPNTAESDRIIAELRAKNAGDARHIEELENRIFILEDQLDSRRLAAEQRAPATLPPRKTDAGAAPAPKGNGPVAGVPLPAFATPAAADEPSSLLAEQDVEYAGAAAPRAGHASPSHRPMLRLGAAPEPVAAHGEGGPPVQSLTLYRQALETLRAGNPRGALEVFRRFLDGNPRHDYADNAQYWIGECLYDLHEYRAAEPEFRKVIERYPDGNKVPDAMLKLGFTLLAQQQQSAGRQVLESLTRAFPKHEAARLAAYRLAHPDAADPVQELPAANADQRAAKSGGPLLGTIAPLAPARQRP